MRTELVRLHARLGATMIYVTHDQVEAMTMGNRICVMRDGRIMQVATPAEIYACPANLFVAGFIGSPSMNFFAGTLQREGGQLRFVETNAAGTPLRVDLPGPLGSVGAARAGQPVILGVRPEDVREAPAGEATLTARVDLVEPLGAETLLHLATGATNFIARVRPTHAPARGALAHFAFDLAKAHLFDPVTEERFA
jgi:multiple sugar transport system ATP-binding protein